MESGSAPKVKDFEREPVIAGSIVHYVDSIGDHLPAIVLKVGPNPKGNALVDLKVFRDNSDRYVHQCVQDAKCRPDSWHWIEGVL